MAHLDDPFIAALGAVGTWLLVAGPLFQATMELREQRMDQQRLFPGTIEPPRPIAAWWWLLPPVAYWKHHVERERVRREVLRHTPAEDVERMLAFSSKALGWLAVAGGATLIAVKETWELGEIAGWPAALPWVVSAGVLLLAAGNAAVHASRTTKILHAAGSATERGD